MENIVTVINGLKSENKESIKESLKIIKEDGDLSIIPQLIDILRDPSIKREVHQAVLAIFSDIRDSKFPEILGKYILNEKDCHLKAELIKICWETPVNMSWRSKKVTPPVIPQQRTESGRFRCPAGGRPSGGPRWSCSDGFLPPAPGRSCRPAS